MPDAPPRFQLDVTVAGVPHYRWNDDRSGLVADTGPVDPSRPFFIPGAAAAPDDVPGSWDGWTELGWTTDDGDNR